MCQRQETAIHELLRRYTAAFDAFDPSAIASLYRFPCAVSDADGIQTYQAETKLVEKFAANCAAMRDLGYHGADFNILDTEALGTDQCSVTVGWRIKTTGSDIEFRTLYICHCVNNAWRIFNANVYPGSFSDTV